MTHLRKEHLPERVVRDLKLDEMTEVFWSEEKGKYVSADHKPMLSLAFAGVGLVTVSYSVEVHKAEHYMLRDDPYSAERAGIRSVGISIKKPSYATHYCLGTKTSHSSVTSGERKSGNSVDHFPIVYLYHNEFTPFKEE